MQKTWSSGICWKIFLRYSAWVSLSVYIWVTLSLRGWLDLCLAVVPGQFLGITRFFSESKNECWLSYFTVYEVLLSPLSFIWSWKMNPGGLSAVLLASAVTYQVARSSHPTSWDTLESLREQSAGAQDARDWCRRTSMSLRLAWTALCFFCIAWAIESDSVSNK